MSIRRLLVALMLLIIVGCSPQQPTATPEPTSEPTEEAQVQAESVRVLRLDSNHAEFAWSQEIRRGVLQGLSDNGYDEGKNMVFEDRYLDTKRKTTQEYFDQISTETIDYIRDTQPDMVIVNDDTATRLVVQPLRDEGIRFVILGLNGKPEEYEIKDNPNITGVLERPHVAEMMGWIEQVFGDDVTVAMLAEESITSERMFGDGSIQQTVEASAVKFGGLTLTNDYVAWQEYVEHVHESNDVLFLGAYASLRSENGEPIEPLAALQWTLENSKIPVMGFWEEAVHIGTLGGPIISGYTQGYEAALKAAEILDGASPSDIPFDVPPRGKLMVNSQAMQHWSVKIPINLLEVSEIVEA